MRRPFASRSASRLSIAAATFSPSQAWTVPRTDVLEGQREGQLERQPEAAVEKTIDMVGEGDSYFFKNHLANNDHDISGRLTRVLAVNTPPVD